MDRYVKPSIRFALAAFLLIAMGTASVVAEEPPPTPPPSTYSNNPQVAVVGDKPIMLDDLKNAQIQDMMVQLHSMQSILLKQKAVDMLMDDHPEILDIQAKRIDQKDIANLFKSDQGLKELAGLNPMQVQNVMRNYLQKMKREAYLSELEARYQLAVQKGWVVDFFKAPNDFILVAGIGTAKLWFDSQGDDTRKVFLMEYSDFLCPFCKKVQTTINMLRKRYADRVQFGYRHFPLHKEAYAISEAVECARDQGRFWEYQNMIYENPRIFKESDKHIKYAEKAGVKDIDGFRKCLEDGKFRDRVQRDFQDGIELGIQGTPTFIIGTYNLADSTIHGEMFSGAVADGKFIRTIEKYLKLSKN